MPRYVEHEPDDLYDAIRRLARTDVLSAAGFHHAPPERGAPRPHLKAPDTHGTTRREPQLMSIETIPTGLNAVAGFAHPDDVSPSGGSRAQPHVTKVRASL